MNSGLFDAAFVYAAFADTALPMRLRVAARGQTPRARGRSRHRGAPVGSRRL